MKKQKRNIKYIPESKSWMIDDQIIAEENLTEQEIIELRELCAGTAQVMYGNNLDGRKTQQVL